jgi:hypothetical protein
MTDPVMDGRLNPAHSHDGGEMTCVSIQHALVPAQGVVLLTDHGCSRDGRWLPVCDECLAHFAHGGIISCMACALDNRGIPSRVAAQSWRQG